MNKITPVTPLQLLRAYSFFPHSVTRESRNSCQKFKRDDYRTMIDKTIVTRSEMIWETDYGWLVNVKGYTFYVTWTI